MNSRINLEHLRDCFDLGEPVTFFVFANRFLGLDDLESGNPELYKIGEMLYEGIVTRRWEESYGK